MAPMQRPARALPRQMTSTLVARETSRPARQKGKAVEMMVTWGESPKVGELNKYHLSAQPVEGESSSNSTN